MTVSQTTDNTPDFGPDPGGQIVNPITALLPAEPDFYAELAATLHSIADDIATLAGRGLPQDAAFHIDMQPRGKTDEEKIHAIDVIGETLVGRSGETRQMSNGSYHHGARGYRGRILIDVYNSVASPEKRAMEEELARLRAEVAAAKAEAEQARAEGGE